MAMIDALVPSGSMAGRHMRRLALALIPSPTILSTDETGQVGAPLVASVGEDALNLVPDVFIVQSLLERRLPKPHSPVAVTGVIDPGTVLALKAYQAVVMNMNPPTG